MEIEWHKIWQEVLDKHLPLLSGKEVEMGDREFSRQIRLDYYFQAKDRQNQVANAPLWFLKKYNVMEFKGPDEDLSPGQVRYYAGRALVVEGIQAKPSRVGEVTLTIMTNRLPKNVLATREFAFERVTPWLYHSTWIKHMDIYVFVISKTRGIEAGDGMALLQALDGNPRYRMETWHFLMKQNFANTADLKRIIMKIDKEVGMSLADEFRLEGEIRGEIRGEMKGELKGLLKMLRFVPSSQRTRLEQAIAAVETHEQLEELEAEIYAFFQESA